MVSDGELRKKAKKIAKAKSEFYTHLGIYVAVNIFLIAMWYVTIGPGGFPWFVFPLFGWGIGVTGHAFDTFYGKSYIEKKTEEEFEKLKKSN